jgi:hypothetical protein
MKNYFLWGIILLTGSYNLYGGEDRRMLREEGERDSMLKEWDDDRIPEKIKNYKKRELLIKKNLHDKIIDVCHKKTNAVALSSVSGGLAFLLAGLFITKTNTNSSNSIKFIEENKKKIVVGGGISGLLGGLLLSLGYFSSERATILEKMKEIERLKNRINIICKDESLSDAKKEGKLEEDRESLQEAIKQLNEMNT